MEPSCRPVVLRARREVRMVYRLASDGKRTGCGSESDERLGSCYELREYCCCEAMFCLAQGCSQSQQPDRPGEQPFACQRNAHSRGGPTLTSPLSFLWLSLLPRLKASCCSLPFSYVGRLDCQPFANTSHFATCVQHHAALINVPFAAVLVAPVRGTAVVARW